MKYLNLKSKSFNEDNKTNAEPVAAGDSRITNIHWTAIVSSGQAKSQKEMFLLDALGLTKK
jgi:hypothetical protein